MKSIFNLIIVVVIIMIASCQNEPTEVNGKFNVGLASKSLKASNIYSDITVVLEVFKSDFNKVISSSSATLDSDGKSTIKYKLPSGGYYTFIFNFYYGSDKLLLAIASKGLEVKSGNNDDLTIKESDFEPLPDSDDDGYSNIYEVINGSDPGNSDCVNGDIKDCRTNEGECKKGVAVCMDSKWSICEGGIIPTIETCDSLDNDCDGNTDENCMEFVMITVGTFMMGSPSGESNRDIDETKHVVTLTYDFKMQNTEVTQEQFALLMEYNPSSFSSCGDDCPVETVNWHEALAFCNELSKQNGYEQCYECTGSGISVNCDLKTEYAKPQECPGYRLPTEAEWEYAARAGTTTAYYCGDNESCLEDIAWYSSNSGSKTHAVGQKEPNDWGLYDMSGNVYEWLWDWHANYDGDTTDPVGASAGSSRVGRGGGWSYNSQGCRSAFRNDYYPSLRRYYRGFRIVRSMP